MLRKLRKFLCDILHPNFILERYVIDVRPQHWEAHEGPKHFFITAVLHAVNNALRSKYINWRIKYKYETLFEIYITKPSTWPEPKVEKTKKKVRIYT